MNACDDVTRAALSFLTPLRPASAAPGVAPDALLDGPFGDIALWRTGDGPAVLLVHGWSGSHEDMQAFTAPLVAAGRSVMSIDLPAHGRSAGDMASIPDLAAALLAVARAVGPLESVVAHSVGCAATALAMSRGLGVQRAMLIGAPSRYAYFARAYAQQAGVDPDAMVQALRDRDIDVDSIDLPRMAPALQAEALLAHSRDDQVVPFASSEAIAAAWPGACLLARDGLGHKRILSDPDVLGAGLAFLAA